MILLFVKIYREFEHDVFRNWDQTGAIRTES